MDTCKYVHYQLEEPNEVQDVVRNGWGRKGGMEGKQGLVKQVSIAILYLPSVEKLKHSIHLATSIASATVDRIRYPEFGLFGFREILRDCGGLSLGYSPDRSSFLWDPFRPAL